MTRITTALVKKLVKDNNADGSITCSYIYSEGKNNYNINFSNGVTLTFESSITRSKVFRILKHELLFEQDFNFQSDETEGIIEAAKRGENPFAYTIISA